MKIVNVQFKGVGQEYAYIFALSDDVKSGDYVVVDSPYDGFVTARVKSVSTSLTGGKATKYVAAYVDLSAYNARKEAEQRAAEIKKVLSKKLKAFEEAAIFKMLATYDDEAASLLKELQDIKL